MKTNMLNTFSVRDLRIRSGDLVKCAAKGKLSVITKWGRPSVLAIPFDRRLVALGLDKDLALFLFERKLVTLAKAAKIAGVTLDEFMDLLAQTGTVAVDYPVAELDDEMKLPRP